MTATRKTGSRLGWIAAALLLGATPSAHPGPAEAAKPAAAPAAPAQGAAPRTVTLRYEAHRNFDWVLPEQGMHKIEGDLPVRLGAREHFAVNLDGQSLQVDTDGNGSFDVTATGEKGLVRLRAAAGDATSTYAVRLAFNGNWWYGTSGSWRAEVGGHTLRLFDVNGDGDVTDVGTDAILVGDGKHAAYLSEVIALDGHLHTLAIEGGTPRLRIGAYASASEAAPAMGMIDLVGGFGTQGRLLSAVIQSEDERFSFDLAQHPKGLRVPVGTYTFVTGQVGKGESRVTVAPGDMGDFVVEADKTLRPTWGGPLQAEFTYVRRGGKVTFSPDLVTYTGRAGETYSKWTPAGSSPEFIIRTKPVEPESAEGPTQDKEVARIRFGGC